MTLATGPLAEGIAASGSTEKAGWVGCACPKGVPEDSHPSLDKTKLDDDQELKLSKKAFPSPSLLSQARCYCCCYLPIYTMS